MPQLHRRAALLVTALGLVMGGAHLLELPVRIGYEAEFYMRVTSTLYRFFGLVGGPVQVLAVVLAIGLAWRSRARPGFRFTLAGALCLAASIVLWFLLVEPVNAAWFDALRVGQSEAVHAYAQLRSRWESGHAIAFVAWLIGYILLLEGVLRSPR